MSGELNGTCLELDVFYEFVKNERLNTAGYGHRCCQVFIDACFLLDQ